MVPESYAIGMDQLEDTEAPGGHGRDYDPKNLDVKVRSVGSKVSTGSTFFTKLTITTGISRGPIFTMIFSRSWSTATSPVDR